MSDDRWADIWAIGVVACFAAILISIMIGGWQGRWM